MTLVKRNLDYCIQNGSNTMCTKRLSALFNSDRKIVGKQLEKAVDTRIISRLKERQMVAEGDSGWIRDSKQQSR